MTLGLSYMTVHGGSIEVFGWNKISYVLIMVEAEC